MKFVVKPKNGKLILDGAGVLCMDSIIRQTMYCRSEGQKIKKYIKTHMNTHTHT